MRCRLLHSNDSGIVLIAVVWITVFLSALVFIIGREAQAEIYLAKYQIAKVKTKAYVWSGLIYALAQLRKEFPTNGSGAMKSKDQPQDPSVHKPVLEISMDAGYFRISHPGEKTSSEQNTDTQWFQDEADRINLNGLTANNYKVFQELLMILGVEENVALDIARSVVDWKDSDYDILEQGQGKEDDYYLSQPKPYRCKNRPFDSLEELLLVKGMTAEIFLKLESYITVFPKNGELRINFMTAPEEILLALARALCGPKTNTDRVDADGLVKKILDYRKGFLGEAPENGQKIDLNNMKLNAKERAIYFTLMTYKALLPEAFRFDLRGGDRSTNVETDVEFIIDLRTAAVLSMQRNGN